jgi:sugar phosphate isomerase/epimerase
MTIQPRLRSEFSRRTWLKAVGMSSGALLASHTLAWADEAARAKAKRLFKWAINVTPYSQMPVEEAAKLVRSQGFDAVLTMFRFADVRFDPASPDWAAADKIVGTFERHGLAQVSLWGYHNPIDPDPAKRARGQARIECLIKNWRRFGSPIVTTQAGTMNPKSEWDESPENASDAAFEATKQSIARLAAEAEKSGATLAIEGYWGTVINSVERMQRLLREVASPALKVAMDPTNFVRPENRANGGVKLVEMFEALGDRVVEAHIQEYTTNPGDGEHPKPGDGEFDIPLYLRLLTQRDRSMYLLFEHVKVDDAVAARQYVARQFDIL